MKIIAIWIPVCLLILQMAGCKLRDENHQETYPSAAEDLNTEMDPAILIPVESITSDYFPCNDCHSELIPNPQRRELVEMHDDIIFNHDSENRWCLACHDQNQRDSLRLASGRLLGFNESYELCGQCHGPKYRDWKLGIHGKRTGEWNGKKQYFLCVNCHDPHAPRFKSLQPMPPPIRPSLIKIDSTYEKAEQTSASP